MKKYKLSSLLAGALLAPTAHGSNDDILSLSLEELLKIEISVSSLKIEDEADVLNTVSKVQKGQWQAFEYRRGFEPIQNIEGIEVYNSQSGIQSISIRGYTERVKSNRGVAVLFDGVPLNGYSFGNANYAYSLLPSALLNSVEVAKGPISTIYGPDAFHGAIAFLPEHYQASRNTARVTLGESGVEHLNALANVALDSVKLTTNLALVTDEDSVIKDTQRPEGEREESYQSIGLHQGIALGDHYVGILFSEADADDMMTSNGAHYDKPGRMDRNRLQTLYYKYHYPILPEHQLRLTSWASSSYVDIVADVGRLNPFSPMKIEKPVPRSI